MKLSGIKLIIWDLDETLWRGTLSEESVFIPEQIKIFLEKTLDVGIVHSICSKNDFEMAKERLVKENLWDFFVFPSIDWSPKGVRIKNLIADMGLRENNVLFVDDNIQNLMETKYYCQNIKTISPQELSTFETEIDAMPKTDIKRKRLAQYKVLEKKNEASKKFGSNIEFLNSSGIKVEIIEDCNAYTERIFELMMRSNQLNYTKYRQDRDAFEQLMDNPNIRKGAVKVKDNYGDYGIVGFFAIKSNKVIHYFFSCRTLGMLVEQYIYMMLGCPSIEVVGEVITQLNDQDIPEWINRKEDVTSVKKSEIQKKILFKGPCDLLQMYAFIKETDLIDNEFTYTNDSGILIEGHNHTATIATALSFNKETKAKVLSEFRWLDSKMFTTKIGTGKYDYIFLSLLTDGSMGVYRHKKTGARLSICEKYYNLTDSSVWPLYLNQKIYDENIGFTEKELKEFSDSYEYLENEDWSITLESLDLIYKHIPNTSKLVLMLGSEIDYSKDRRPSFLGRSKEHAALNRKVEKWTRGKNNVLILNYTEYIHGENDYVDSVDHYTKKVYYNFANDIVKIINADNSEKNILLRGRTSIFEESVIAIIKRFYHKYLKRK